MVWGVGCGVWGVGCRVTEREEGANNVNVPPALDLVWALKFKTSGFRLGGLGF